MEIWWRTYRTAIWHWATELRKRVKNEARDKRKKRRPAGKAPRMCYNKSSLLEVCARCFQVPSKEFNFLQVKFVSFMPNLVGGNTLDATNHASQQPPPHLTSPCCEPSQQIDYSDQFLSCTGRRSGSRSLL
jgi:hypothetical protein